MSRDKEPKESFYIPDPEPSFTITYSTEPKNQLDRKTILRHSILFVITFISVSLVSTVLVGKELQTTLFLGMLVPYPTEVDLMRGILFATLLLSFLTFHEFGHYFAAVYHKVSVSLPYYIPIPVGIGTLGAVIRIREQIHETKKLFDIGAAGPIAGFIVSVIILFIGFATLPEAEFLNEFGDHTYLVDQFNETGEYPEMPQIEEGQIAFFFGGTPLYNFFASLFPNSPPLYEIMHYPFLLAGWFGLFFTALNLMPVGQLDGGHILYSLIGYEKHKIVARIFFIGITILASFEAIFFIKDTAILVVSWIISKINGQEIPIISEALINNYLSYFEVFSWIFWIWLLFFVLQKSFYKELYWVVGGFTISLLSTGVYFFFFAQDDGMSSSLIWLFWIFFITFFVKVEHPPVLIEKPLSPTRKVLGWLSMLIFVLSISLNPLSII